MAYRGNYSNYQISFGPSLTRAVKILIISNAIIFVLQLLEPAGGLINHYLGLSVGGVKNFYIHQFITYAFLHAGIMHLLFNMLSLWMFGSELENYWGTKNFSFFYVYTALVGGISAWVYYSYTNFTGIIVGASGAIMGILVSYAFIWPDREVFFMGIFPIKMKYLIPILILIEFTTGGNIAHAAHIGGGLAGALYIWLNRKYDFTFEFSLSHYLKKRKFLKYQEEMLSKLNAKDRVDELLDKISKKGMKSLTKKEKQFLKEASKDYYN